MKTLSPRVELYIGVLLVAIAALTVVWPDWLEGIFGIDPDHGDGNAEIAIVLIAAVAGALLWLHGRARARRSAVAGVEPT